MLADLIRWVQDSYPYAVVRRFLDLELLDRSFGLAAQVFVALLPLIIVVVAVFAADDGQVIAEQMVDRFGLAGAADAAVRALFTTPGAGIAVSWLAIAMILLSAFSLSRRISRVYGSIFGMPSLQRSQLWRAFAWIAVQVALFSAVSFLRQVNRDFGPVISVLAIVTLLGVWFLGDVLGYRLLVPTVPRYLLVPTAIVSMVGRGGVGVWSAIYMPATLSEQAEQFGPIGVTFSLFTLILAGVIVNLAAPVIVTVWDERRRGAPERPPLAAAESVAE